MMSPTGYLYWGMEVVALTASERSICYSLMKAYPDPVRVDVLLDRLDSEATGNAVDVYVHRIRKKLKTLGAPNPISAMRNRNHPRAYIWRPA
jgi:DNA-binding response OmpR family regulator